MVIDFGEEPHIKRATFKVVANIYSESENNYIYRWLGGEFSCYDKAYDFWDFWSPPKEEIEAVMKKRRDLGDYSHHEIEIGVFSSDDRETACLAFMNCTVDYENEKDSNV